MLSVRLVANPTSRADNFIEILCYNLNVLPQRFYLHKTDLLPLLFEAVYQMDGIAVENFLYYMFLDMLHRYLQKPTSVTVSVKQDWYTLELLGVEFDEVYIAWAKKMGKRNIKADTHANYILTSCCNNPTLVDHIIFAIMHYLEPQRKVSEKYEHILKAVYELKRHR